MIKILIVILVIIGYINCVSYWADSTNGFDDDDCGPNNSCKSIKRAISNFRRNENSSSESLQLYLLQGYYGGDNNSLIDIFNLDVSLKRASWDGTVVINYLNNVDSTPVFFISQNVDNFPTNLAFYGYTFNSLKYNYLFNLEQVGVFSTSVNVSFYDCIIDGIQSNFVSMESNSFSNNNLIIQNTSIVAIDQYATPQYVFLLKNVNTVVLEQVDFYGNDHSGFIKLNNITSFKSSDSTYRENNLVVGNNLFDFSGGGIMEFKNDQFTDIMLSEDSIYDEEASNIYIENAQHLYLTNCTFSQIDGRSLITIDTNYTILDSTFTNSSFQSGPGSVILSKALNNPTVEAKIINSIISNINQPHFNFYEVGKLSTIYLSHISNTFIKNTTFTENSGSITAISSPLRISGSTKFQNNIGSIFCDTRQLEFLDSTTIFINNANVDTNESTFDVKTSQGVLCHYDYDNIYEGCVAIGPDSYMSTIDEINDACTQPTESMAVVVGSNSSNKTAVIVGSIIGGVALISIIAGISVYIYLKKKDPYNGDINPKHRKNVELETQHRSEVDDIGDL